MTDKELLHEIEMSRAATVAIRKGIEKAKAQKYLSSSQYGRGFISQYAIPFAKALEKETLKTEQGRARVTNIVAATRTMIEVFCYCTPEVIAVIGLKSIFDSLGVAKYDKPRTAEAASFIGRRIEDEVRTSYYQVTAPEHVVSHINKELSTSTSSPSYRRYGAKRGAEKLLEKDGWNKEDLFPSWSPLLKSRVGLYIIEVAIKLGWVTREPRKITKTKTQGFLDLSPEVYADFAHYQHHLERYSVINWPLIEIPRDWELQEGASRNNYSGGYYHEWIRKQYRLCRSYYSETEFGREAIDLVNILNKTAWNIDNDLYEVAQLCLDRGDTIGSLKAVKHRLREELAKPMPEQLKALHPESDKITEWKKERSMMHTALADSIKRNIRSRDALTLADKFRSQSRFYLSWSCDWRGRVYSQQPLLHPQTSDIERSLINFADGCRLDSRGKYWASQALGSAYLGSKAGYEERSKWTKDNKELIQAIAEHPLSMQAKWEKVSDPWKFLQLCLEWNRVVLTEEKHLWDVPISADASASGLQLLSAMRRDPKGMKWSNLFRASSPSEAPQDAYREVLRVAKGLVRNDNDSAWMAEHLNNRKLGKTILMKKLYGASLQTNRKDIELVLIDDGLYPDPFSWKEVNKLTTLINSASRIVFPEAFEALEWMTKLYNQAKKNGNDSFNWSTPNGDSIHLVENKTLSKVVRTSHLGEVTLGYEQGDTPDHAAMKRSLTPSFVHSYDAAVLKSSFKQWTQPLAVIHDCINVLPNDMESALERVKKGFVHVCSGDPLAALADDLGVSEKQLKRLPQGKADLEDVLESTYIMN